MFFHVFKYKLKFMFNDKSGLFWLAAWPLLLASIFSIVFSNLGTYDSFEKIQVNLVKSDNQDEFLSVLESTEMFEISVSDLDTAKDNLAKAKTVGYITTDNSLKVHFNSQGMNQSITKFILDSYIQTTATIENIANINPQAIDAEFLQINQKNDYIAQRQVSKDKINPIVIYFYTILGMAVLLGATHSIGDVKLIQATQSNTAARTSISPNNSTKLLFYSLSATLIFHLITLYVLFIYIKNILKVDFGDNTTHIILLLFAGGFASIMLGAFISMTNTKSYSFKVGIITATTMIFSFLSGMMSLEVKYIVREKALFLAYINPVDMITDGLYSLYYYGVGRRYFISLALLIAVGVLSGIGTFLISRRRQYASI